MSYRYIHAESPKPDRWHGTHYLNCLHSLNHRSQIEYQMFCNISRIRYVDDWRVTDQCWNRII